MNSLVEHWFATCTIIATAGFWTIMAIVVWHEAKQ